MRIVFDTNVLIAALISHGVCSELVRYCAKNHELFLSDYILQEIQRTLSTKFKYPAPVAMKAVQLYSGRGVKVTPVPIEKGACKDETDFPVLGTALAARCDCLITGDKDLLLLEKFQGVRILQPNAFWDFEDKFKKR